MRHKSYDELSVLSKLKIRRVFSLEGSKTLTSLSRINMPKLVIKPLKLLYCIALTTRIESTKNTSFIGCFSFQICWNNDGVFQHTGQITRDDCTVCDKRSYPARE